jgi:hypothetical protein
MAGFLREIKKNFMDAGWIFEDVTKVARTLVMRGGLHGMVRNGQKRSATILAGFHAPKR